MQPSHFTPIPLDKAYRLLNHGPTVLVSASHGGVDNVMSAAWACALDFSPPKGTMVLDKATRTRELVEASGLFALQLPTVPMAALTVAVGTHSAKTPLPTRCTPRSNARACSPSTTGCTVPSARKPGRSAWWSC